MTKKKSAEEPIEEHIQEETTQDNQSVETQVDESAEKLAQLNDSHLRLMAEFDNYRKRTIKEKAELLKSASESVLVNILPLVDDFERGIVASQNTEDVAALREGMELIYGKFLAFLAQNGVKAIPATNEVFDTEFHEAITTIPAPTEDLKGKVIDCVKNGYTLNEKVIRFAQVVVGE